MKETCLACRCGFNRSQEHLCAQIMDLEAKGLEITTNSDIDISLRGK